MADIKEFEEKMNKTIDTLLEDYATIRAGRANPHILDKSRLLGNTYTASAGCQCFRT